MPKYIITTGDISDFDGFLTFPIYLKAAIANGIDNIVFIMNYPAYFRFETPPNDDYTNKGMKIDKIQYNDYLKGEDNLGYNYSYKDVYNFYQSFFNGINIRQADELQHAMEYMAYLMCYKIWESIGGFDSRVNFIFVNGGVNDLNPFSLGFIKNEFMVYKDTLNFKYIISAYVNLREVENKDTNFKYYKDSISFFETIKETYDIYIDMNGSFAFFDKDVNKLFYDKSIFNCIKVLSIMGGVYNNQLLTTLSLPFINRFTSATMNQFYAPYKTYLFLSGLFEMNKITKILTVSNNYINTKFAWEGKDKYDNFKQYLKDSKILHTDDENIFNKLCYAYYDKESKYKPFDIVSAYALVLEFTTILKIYEQTRLLYSPKYAISIIDKSTREQKETYINYVLENMCKNKDIINDYDDCNYKFNYYITNPQTYTNITNVLNMFFILYMLFINGFDETEKTKEAKEAKEKFKNLLINMYINLYKNSDTYNINNLFYLFDIYDVDDITQDDIRTYMNSSLVPPL